MRRQTSPPPAPAGDIARLGEELREARLAHGLAVEDLAASLRIRAQYLEALEAGRLRDLPAPVYALGFVRSYARALGLDAEEAARRLRAGGGGGRTELAFPEPTPARAAPAPALMLLGAVLVLGTSLGWYAWSGRGAREVDSVPAAAPEAARQGSPAPTPSLADPGLPVAALVPPPAAAPALPDEGRIVLRARAEAWVQVRAGQGGPVLLNRVLQPGESWAAPAREGLLLSTGNAGGLEILVDGQPVPGLGAARAVRREVPIEPERLKAGPIPPPQ